MTVNDIADLLFAARGRIDFYWNFYVVVVIAVIGWLVSLKRTLTTSNKVLVSAVYLIAAATNLMGLYSSYAIAEALRTDLLRVAATTPLTDTRNLLQQHSYLSHRMAALWIHLAIGTAILFAIWFARPSEPEPTAAKAPTTPSVVGHMPEASGPPS
jgi:putative effector of murein hydrolase